MLLRWQPTCPWKNGEEAQMASFEKKVRQYQRLAKIVKEREIKLAQLQKEQQDLLQELSEQCRTCFVAAAIAFEEKFGYQFNPLNVSVRFNFEKNVVGFSTRLRTKNGYEPDEEFTDREEEEFNVFLKPLIDEKLVAAQLPVTFGGMRFPLDYYMK